MVGNGGRPSANVVVTTYGHMQKMNGYMIFVD